MARTHGFQPVPTTEPSDDDGIELHGVNTEHELEIGVASRANASPERFQADVTTVASTANKLSRLNGLALVISLQIGSGIFTAPSQVSSHVPSPGAGLLVWFLGGLLVWTGAASFIELGLRLPANGGIQEYLRAVYGDAAGFLFSWMWVAVAKPAANAIISTIFADYLLGGLFGGTAGLSPWLVKLGALLCVASVTFVNCLGATAGARAANVFLVLKIGALSSIIFLGAASWLLGYGDGVPATSEGWFGVPLGQSQQSVWSEVGDFATALFGALFCYGGWETVRYLAASHHFPTRVL
jgi:L-type amino acid transporter 6